MTPERLAEIASAEWNAGRQDVAELIAEVRRLRALMSAAIEPMGNAAGQIDSEGLRFDLDPLEASIAAFKAAVR